MTGPSGARRQRRPLCGVPVVAAAPPRAPTGGQDTPRPQAGVEPRVPAPPRNRREHKHGEHAHNIAHRVRGQRRRHVSREVHPARLAASPRVQADAKYKHERQPKQRRLPRALSTAPASEFQEPRSWRMHAAARSSAPFARCDVNAAAHKTANSGSQQHRQQYTAHTQAPPETTSVRTGAPAPAPPPHTHAHL